VPLFVLTLFVNALAGTFVAGFKYLTMKNLYKLNPLVQTSLLVVIFYLIFIFAKFLGIAPNVVSILLPFGTFFLNRWYTGIFSIALFILIIISGFVIEGIGIFLLFMLPVLIYKSFNRKFLKHILITIVGVFSFSLMYCSFGNLLPEFLLKNNLMWIFFLSYIIFANFYGFLLNKLKDEIANLIKRMKIK